MFHCFSFTYRASKFMKKKKSLWNYKLQNTTVYVFFYFFSLFFFFRLQTQSNKKNNAYVKCLLQILIRLDFKAIHNELVDSLEWNIAFNKLAHVSTCFTDRTVLWRHLCGAFSAMFGSLYHMMHYPGDTAKGDFWFPFTSSPEWKAIYEWRMGQWMKGPPPWIHRSPFI